MTKEALSWGSLAGAATGAGLRGQVGARRGKGAARPPPHSSQKLAQNKARDNVIGLASLKDLAGSRAGNEGAMGTRRGHGLVLVAKP